jgi:hypothetical protein
LSLISQTRDEIIIPCALNDLEIHGRSGFDQITAYDKTHFIIYISHVHNELHVITEVVYENPSDDILRDIVSRELQNII